MRSCLFAGVVLLTALTGFAGDVDLAADVSEIVVATDAPKTVRFAAKTLNRCLGEALGKALPVVETPTKGRTSVVLGDNALSRAAGIDVSSLARDAFVIKAAGRCVYIAGRDDARFDIESVLKGGTYWALQDSERATLFGVYEFLERFAGCRFYFPGELGTVVPKRTKVTVPEGTLSRAPVFTVRDPYLQGDGPVPGETDADSRRRWMVEDWLLLRMQTANIRCCHGQDHMEFRERFAKTHPEYFRAVKVGTNLVRQVNDTQLCQSSKMWDEIYEDAKAYLSGKPPSSRGLGKEWGRAYYGRNTIDAMPEDGMQRCACPDCEARYNAGRVNWATDLVWEQTSRLADRLEKDGFSFRITQMAYPEYRNVPKNPINTNVWVMVAESGPWSCGSERRMALALDDLRNWTGKVGHKVWMWTYPSKFDTRKTEGVPCYAPRACGRYFRQTVPYSIGSFVETETQDALFSYLNNYAFSRVAWDKDIDIDAVVDEHHRLMFGAAAPEMKAFLDDLETRWMRDVIGAWIFPKHDGKTELDAAPDIAIWKSYLTREVRDGWKRLFDAAEKKVAAESLEAKRVALYRKHFLDYIVKTGDAFDAATDPAPARRRYAALKPGENLFPPMKEPVHIVATDDTKGASWGVEIPDVKPGARYRLSGIVKLKDVRPNPENGTGAFFDGYLGDWCWFPRRGPYPAGTADWHYREYTFRAGKDFSRKSCMRYCLSNCSGEAWIDCLTLQEIDDKGNVVPQKKNLPLPKGFSTVKHELDALLEGGHVQGATCDESGIYLIHSLGIVKVDWNGRKIVETSAPKHAGDGFVYKGKLYVAFGTAPVDGKCGVIGVYDAMTLKQLAFKPVDTEPIDGLVILNDVLYYGICHGPKALPTTRVGMANMKLEKIGEKTLKPSFKTVFGVQTMATDGKDLFFVPYVASNSRAPVPYNCLRLSPQLDILEEMEFGSAEGFGMVPPSVFPDCRTPAFFNVSALGGNQQGWRKDPTNNPPRISFWFRSLGL